MAYINGKKVLQVVKTEFTPALYQTKTITPQTFTPEVIADTGYAALSKVKLKGVLVDPHESYTTDTDDDIAYQKSVPTGALKYASLDKVGGMSYKSNNLYNDNASLYTKPYDYYILPISLQNGNYTLNATLKGTSMTGVVVGITPYGERYNQFNLKTCLTTTGVTSTITFTVDDTWTSPKLVIYASNQDKITEMFENYEIMLNSGSSALPYEPYFTGIRDSAITSITSKDSNNTTLETKTINASIQALTGYGWGINDTLYNYIDYENKKFIQKVGRVDLSTLSNWVYDDTNKRWNRPIVENMKVPANNSTPSTCIASKYLTYSINDMASDFKEGIGISQSNNRIYVYTTDGVNVPSGYLYYELETPVETDISAYLDDDSIVVSDNGTLTFDNTYEQSVPSEVTYLVEANNG